MSVPSPREVFDQLINGIATGQWSELADLYAEDAVVEHPHAIPSPERMTGREEIRRHFTRDHPIEFLTAYVHAVHETSDPEMIIAEFDYDLRAKATGLEFRSANIQVLRVRAGLIVATRDFHDHFAMAKAIGALPAMIAAS